MVGVLNIEFGGGGGKHHVFGRLVVDVQRLRLETPQPKSLSGHCLAGPPCSRSVELCMRSPNATAMRPEIH